MTNLEGKAYYRAACARAWPLPKPLRQAFTPRRENARGFPAEMFHFAPNETGGWAGATPG